MSNIDFKISSIKKSGGKTEVLARFYTGAVTIENEPVDNEEKPVEAYRRTEKIGEKFYELEGDVPKEKIEALLRHELGLKATKLNTAAIVEQVKQAKDDTEAQKLVKLREIDKLK